MRRTDAVELYLHSLLTSASDAGVWLVARPGYSNSKETAAISVEWDDIRDLENVERTKRFSFSENWNTIPRMSRLESSHNSDWAILALV